MEPFVYGRFALALGGVLGLIVLCLWGLRGLSFPSFGRRNQSLKRLEILDSLRLDEKRRIVILRQDGKEYTLLLSPQGDRVLSKKEGSLLPLNAPEPSFSGTFSS